MIRSFIAIAALAGALPALAANSITKENTDLTLKYGLQGYTIDGNTNTVRIMSTNLFLAGQHQLSNTLDANFVGGAVLQAGTYDRKGANNQGPKPSNRLSLKESNLDWHPYDFVSLKVGAISQRELYSSMLLGSSAFLAAKETIKIGSEDFNVKLVAQQAYANNKDLSSTLPGVDEGLPLFFAEGAYLHAKTGYFKLNAHVLHWAYDKLAAGIATESAFRGNTPLAGTVGSFTGFKYKFMGWYAGAKLDMNLVGDTNLKLLGHYIINDKAPSGKNTGYIGEIGFEFPAFDGRMELIGGYREMESDVSPAYYAKYNNNRKAQYGAIKWKSVKTPLEIKFSGTRALELKPNAYQSDENRFFMEMKSKFDFL